MCSLEGIEHGQLSVLVVRMDEQQCSLWVSGFSVDLYDPLDIEGYRREVNELNLNDRNRYNCLLPTLLYDWVAGQEDHMASYRDSRE